MTIHDGVSVLSGASNSLKGRFASFTGSTRKSPSLTSSSAIGDVDAEDGVDMGLSTGRSESFSAIERFSREFNAESSNMNQRTDY